MEEALDASPTAFNIIEFTSLLLFAMSARYRLSPNFADKLPKVAVFGSQA